MLVFAARTLFDRPGYTAVNMVVDALAITPKNVRLLLMQDTAALWAHACHV